MSSARTVARVQPLAVTIPPPLGRDTRARRAARDALARVLWTKQGERRLPSERALVAALSSCRADDVWWVCETSSAGPVYLLPTREWVWALARFVAQQRVRSVLEVGAGDGFLSACLAHACPRVRVIATDTGAWARPAGRMNDADRAELAGVPLAGISAGAHVLRMAAARAIERFRPDLVVVSWAPPGLLVERAIRAPSRLVLDISVDGDVCGNGMRTWRFEKDFLEGPLETRALCRLDARPRQQRHTRVTLYYGAAHRRWRAPRRGA